MEPGNKNVSVPSIVLPLMSAKAVNRLPLVTVPVIYEETLFSIVLGENCLTCLLKTINCKLARGYTVHLINVFTLISCNFFCLPKYLSWNFFWHSYLFIKPSAGRAVTTSFIGRPQAIHSSRSGGSYCSVLAEACVCMELPERAGAARAGEDSSQQNH